MIIFRGCSCTQCNVECLQLVLCSSKSRSRTRSVRRHSRYFDQLVRIKYWDTGFFEVCRPGTEHKTCALGEYCQCAFLSGLFADWEDEELSPEEERKRELEIEIRHIKKKYDDDWMRYYPYHLDPDYDDEDGNPYDYGMHGDDDEDD